MPRDVGGNWEFTAKSNESYLNRIMTNVAIAPAFFFTFNELLLLFLSSKTLPWVLVSKLRYESNDFLPNNKGIGKKLEENTIALWSN